MEPAGATREQILDLAQGLVQTLGYDGFSFADVAGRVGLRKASIHHHFPTKADLGVELVARFRRDCSARLAALEAEADPGVRIDGFVSLFRETLQLGRMCLCGILASGSVGLPPSIRAEVLAAIAEMEAWLARAIAWGRALGRFRDSGTPEAEARFFLGGLEGALLLARVHGDPGRFEEAARGLLDAIRAR